jgi:hypothetical protein
LNPKNATRKETTSEKYMKNNPFGISDPRFSYQKAKIDRTRDGPTGDFNIHMAAVKDSEFIQKKYALQKTL